jgi:isopentenyl-diphosphate delta-isomerase
VQVELLDEDHRAIGGMDKLSAHEAPGHLHAAFSVFLVDEQGRLLLQRRAATKYHFAGLWSNTCCSHPAPGEDLVTAAAARTRHEIGVDADLRVVGAFTYRAVDESSGLVEHERDTVLVGTVSSSVPVAPHPDEVDETAWVSPADLRARLREDPGAFTPWLAAALECGLP